VILSYDNVRPHIAKVKILSTSMGSLATCRVFTRLYFRLSFISIDAALLISILKYVKMKNGSMNRLLQTFFLSRNSLIVRKVGKSYS